MCSVGGGIVDTLQRRKSAQGRFSTLIKAIQAANLTDTLEKGEFADFSGVGLTLVAVSVVFQVVRSPSSLRRTTLSTLYLPARSTNF